MPSVLLTLVLLSAVAGPPVNALPSAADVSEGSSNSFIRRGDGQLPQRDQVDSGLVFASEKSLERGEQVAVMDMTRQSLGSSSSSEIPKEAAKADIKFHVLLRRELPQLSTRPSHLIAVESETSPPYNAVPGDERHLEPPPSQPPEVPADHAGALESSRLIRERHPPRAESPRRVLSLLQKGGEQALAVVERQLADMNVVVKKAGAENGLPDFLDATEEDDVLPVDPETPRETFVVGCALWAVGLFLLAAACYSVSVVKQAQQSVVDEQAKAEDVRRCLVVEKK